MRRQDQPGEFPALESEWTAEAFLSGDDPVADSSERATELAALVTALTAPARADELGGLEAALVAFNASIAAQPRRAPWRPIAIGMAAAVLGVLAVGSGAAYANLLPTPMQRFAHDVIGAPQPDEDKPASKGTGGSGTSTDESDGSKPGSGAGGLFAPKGRPGSANDRSVPMSTSGATPGSVLEPQSTDAAGAGAGQGSSATETTGPDGSTSSGGGKALAPGQVKKPTVVATAPGQVRPTGRPTAGPGSSTGKPTAPPASSKGKSAATPSSAAASSAKPSAPPAKGKKMSVR